MSCGSEKNYLRATFNKYFASGTTTNVYEHTYTFKGELDLSGISYYPAPQVKNVKYYGLNNATLIFGAKTDTVDMRGWTISNENPASQHYALQSGLLTNHGGEEHDLALIMEDITLKGTIANLGENSGAIVNGPHGIKGGGTFKNISLDGLKIADYNKEAAVGLIISKIPTGTVNFDGIKMINYTNSGTKVASALIGSAGSSYEKYLTMNFSHMKIADEADTNTSTLHNGNVLAHASFIYYYDYYTENPEENKGSGLYLFSESDNNTDDNVTYGFELSDDTEFSDTSNKVFDYIRVKDQQDTVKISDSTLYKPYVYTYTSDTIAKTIDVNPKTGDILKGCGTYEDPYIIETDKQFLTLYKYINEPDDSYKTDTFYTLGDGWKIIKPGTDASDDFCSTKHSVKWENGQFTGDGAEDAVKFGQSGFPTPDDLSRAYYRLGADINLSNITNATYNNIVNDFTGFGTTNRPFVGVWYGKDASGKIHSITLPDKPNTVTYQTYGFIQYAQGAVVKDMIIKTTGNSAATVDSKKTAYIGTAGGGVIAVILGGDNVIDNVTVNADFIVADNSAAIGGYVGNVKKGGLILRNINDSNLSTYRTDKSKGNGCVFLGAIAGKVEDGYVLYEGAGSNAGSYTWDGKGGNTYFDSAISNYSILNGDKLKADCSGLTITRTTYEEPGGITHDSGQIYEATCAEVTVNIPNAAALQVMSMALNSDALNVRPSGYWGFTTWGYTEKSRSRKAAYTDIGCDSAETADYLSAAKYDNAMNYDDYANVAYAFPYLYKYMNVEDYNFAKFAIVHFLNDGYEIHTFINPSTLFAWDSILDFRVESKIIIGRAKWELSTNALYDMGQFGKSFRGLGGLYDTLYGLGSSFHGSFDGNGSTIKLDIKREIYGNEYDEATYSAVNGVAGLFNTIYGSYDYFYNTEYDFKIPDAPESNIKDCFEIKNFKLAGKIAALSEHSATIAGGVVGCMQGGNYAFSAISVDNNYSLEMGVANSEGEIKTKYLGGLIGKINDNGEWPANIIIKDCNLSGTSDKKIVLRSNNRVAGLVGYADMEADNILKILDSRVNYADIETSNNHAGGMIGEAKYATVILEGSTTNGISVSNSVVNTKAIYSTGGLVGNAKCKLYIKNGISTANKIGNNASISSSGGFVGSATDDFIISDIKSINLEIGSYSSIGGVIGKTSGGTASEIKNVNVSDLIMRELTNLDGSPEGIGGVIGKNESVVSIINANVEGTIADDGTYNFQIIGTKQARNANQGVGGVVGYHNYTDENQKNILTLNGCEVDSISISTNINQQNQSYCIAAGGVVGYSRSSIVLDNTGAIKTSNLTIKVPKAADVTNDVMAAGSCFGYMAGTLTSNDTADTNSNYYKRLSATANKVYGKQAGGIIGYTYAASFRLTNILVTQGTVESDEIAGGIVGYLRSGSSAISDVDGKDDTQSTVSNMNISGRVSGGAFGYYLGTAGIRVENIAIKDNTIVSSLNSGTNCSAGGYIGECDLRASIHNYDIVIENNIIVNETEDDILSPNETDNLAVGGVIGSVSCANKGQCLYFDNISLKTNNQIGVRCKKQINAVKLIKMTQEKDAEGNIVNTTYSLSDVSMPEPNELPEAYDYNVIEKLEQDYGYCVGNLVGVLKGDVGKISLYMLSTKEGDGKFVTPVMVNNPPVIDVGRTSSQDIDNYRKYCHIIYGADIAKAKVSKTNLEDMKTEVEKALSAYDNRDTLQTLLQENRLSKESLELFDATYQESYQFSGTDLKINFPILVYRAQNGTLQEVMENITDVMTNIAGASSGDMTLLSVTANKMQCSGSNSTQIKNETPSITVTGSSKRIYTSSVYDGVKDDKLTYTELIYKYNWTSAGSVKHLKEFKIAVFVEEPILYTMHSKIIAGRVTDVDTVKDFGKEETTGSLVMANDSDYSLLLEYCYGKTRTSMSDTLSVDKLFYLTNASGDKELEVGTQLLLVDVTHGNKAYYYTVTEANKDKTQIKFSDFTDASGNAYKNGSISKLPDVTDNADVDYYTDLGGHKLTNAGVEQYLLTVINNSTSDKKELYQIHTDIYIEDSSFASRFQLAPTSDDEEPHLDDSVWDITSIPGLTVSLVKKEDTQNNGNEYTDIADDSMISKSKGIDSKVVFTINARDALYWQEKNKDNSVLLDSSNSGKYIDVAFYLRDKNSNRINLPTGTTFSYKLDDGEYSDYYTITDNAAFYYYKDIRKALNKDFEYSINNMIGDKTHSIEFKLDFSGADLSDITDSVYEAWIDLLRTANKEYPMGSGNMVDSYTEDVQASGTKELGFAIKADDNNQLAINTYPQADASNTINAKTMFDFSEIMKNADLGSGEDVIADKWAEYDYVVDYQLYQKVQTMVEGVAVYQYQPYTGNDININITNGEENATSTNGKAQTIYKFTRQQIQDDEPLSYPCTITINTNSLTSDLKNLTNYKIEATLTVKDKASDGDGQNTGTIKTTKDFFIYTVTKLKLDI